MKYNIIIGRKYAQVLDLPLKNAGLSPLYIPDNPYVDANLSGHADLSVFYDGGKNLLAAPYLKNTEFDKIISKTAYNLKYALIKQGNKYPHDAMLNACRVGERLICNSKNTAEEITALFAGRIINVKQSYSKCSICVVDDNSIITSDRGVEAAALKAGIDVLLISAGYILLPGFDYGFIGGASFMLPDKMLAFTGRLDNHPDKTKIVNYLDTKNIEPVYLTDRPVFDIGSGITLY